MSGDKGGARFQSAGDESLSRRVYYLAMLVIVYTFNFLDRQIIGILAIPIKSELGLSDMQLGLLGGVAFGILYTTLGIPIALLADRSSRTWIMTWALVFWSTMTAACGLAQNFWQLFVARVGVGVGEAGGVAPAYSIISDYFPPHQRARATAVYVFGSPIGSALGIISGGIIASMIDWRAAFFIVGFAGIVLAPLFRMTVPEPQRGRFDAPSASRSPVGFSEVLSVLTRKPSFWVISIGGAFGAMMSYGMFFWLPSFFIRTYGLSLIDASLFYGTIVLIGGISGLWVGSVLADHFGKGSRKAYVLVPAVTLLATVPFFALGLLSETLVGSFFLFLIPTALSIAWSGPIMSTIQQLVPPNMRTTVTAIFLFIANLVGLGLGTIIIGGMSDLFYDWLGTESLRYAILLGNILNLFAAAMFLLAARWLERDWFVS